MSMLIVSVVVLLAWTVRADQILPILAIVEYNGKLQTLHPNDFARANLENYIDFMATASERNADIIVFPKAKLDDVNINRQDSIEYAIEIPCPKDKTYVCHSNQYNKILHKLSCEAELRQIYVLINLMEKTCNKTNCSADEHRLHNTNIIFDKNGRIISKRRLADNPLNTKESFLTETERVFDAISYHLLKAKDIPEIWLHQKQSVNYDSEKHTEDELNNKTLKMKENLHSELKLYKINIANFNGERIKTDDEDIFADYIKYIWNKLQILTLIITIYFLEMM